MNSELRAPLAFHLAGARTRGATEPIEGRGLAPALLARYRDLIALRYDFPLVLVGGDPAGCVRSLSQLVDAALRKTAPRGADGERLRLQVLRVERGIRALVAGGEGGALSALWTTASNRLAAGDRDLAIALARTRAAMDVDGEVVDCGPGVARKLVTHVWRAVQAGKVRRFRAHADRLMLRLGEILRADFVGSAAGRTATELATAFGGGHHGAFDFGEMSRLLTRTANAAAPPSRLERVRGALEVLRGQDFFPASGAPAGEPLVFERCADAMTAYRARLPAMRRLAKALAIAELEVEGLYVEARHDALLEHMFARELRPDDLAMFPDYLVCLDAGHGAAGEGARLLELLSEGPPVKVVVEIDDLDHHAAGNGHAGFGLRSARLASVAMGLGQVHVVQAPAASLYEVQDRVVASLEGPGASLVSVFTGAARAAFALPPYLASAAALEARAFPVFSYAPSAGTEWASRFSLAGNPQPERDWPVHPLVYADADQQRVTEEVPFTYADFAACDRRRAAHFALIPDGADPAGVPSIPMIGPDLALHRVIVDEPVMLEARACADAWRSLQELGGVRNSYAERGIARERAAWEARAKEEVAAAPACAVPAAAAAAATAPAASAPATAASPEAAAVAPSPDAPYIETARCSTCNECTRLNDRMFAYNGNKQAYIKDVDAGTFAQLVQAAENCQLAIIHPGKPRNPAEPNLPELIERAQPYQ